MLFALSYLPNLTMQKFPYMFDEDSKSPMEVITFEVILFQVDPFEFVSFEVIRISSACTIQNFPFGVIMFWKSLNIIVEAEGLETIP